MYGDVLRVSQDYAFNGVTGQIRAGLWWEAQATHRFKYYFDANLCATDNVDPFQTGGVAAAKACGAKKGSSPVDSLGYAKDDEYSDWTQYEPFLEVDIKPTENLTFTPGVNIFIGNRSVNAPVERGQCLRRR